MKQYFGTHVKAVNEDGSVRYRLTEKKLDRYGEVVLPKGAVLNNYKQNPVVLWSHNFGGTKVPIGRLKMDTVEITDDFFDADVKFDDGEDSVDDFSKMISNKVKNGFINAGSIGFRAIDVSKEPVVDGQTSVTHKKWDLLEFSIVPIPALPSALAQREWTEFAKQCKEFGHPIDDIVDKYFTNSLNIQAKPEENDRKYLERRLEAMAKYIEGLENDLNELKDVAVIRSVDKVDLLKEKEYIGEQLDMIINSIDLSDISNSLRTINI